ncbi:MAG: T9SS type A sorting domain-containing protein [Saprospiraceae bacterium]
MKYAFLLTFIIGINSLFLTAQSGYLDTTFGDHGMLVKDLDKHATDFIRDGVLQPDGRIVVTGYTGTPATIFVMRFLSDGDPDTDFGDNGVVRLNFGGSTSRGHAVALQSDGRIVVAGEYLTGSIYDFCLARLNADGSPDSTFGVAGKVISDLGTDFEYPNALAIQTDGKIVAAGRVESKTFSDMAVVRYLSDGQMDPDFGSGGLVVTNFREEDEANDVLIQPDGKIVIGGYTALQAVGDFALVRYLQDGTPDESFGDHGKVETDLAGESELARSILLQPDGKIVATGLAHYFNIFQTADFGIVRYNEDGSLDSSFSDDGMAILVKGESNDIESSVLQHDGKIVIAGRSDYPDGVNRLFLARLLSDGTLDPGFGDQGVVTADIDGEMETAYASMISSDSRIVVIGAVKPAVDYDILLTRFVADFIISNYTTANICYGMNDGFINAEASGGAAPYQYSLDGINFFNNADFNNLAPGTYYVTVKDANGVTGVTGPLVVSAAPEPPLVHTDVVGNNIYVVVDGASENYSYVLDFGSASSDPFFLDVLDGLHVIQVYNEGGCIIYSENVQVNFTAVHPVANDLSFNVFPNPVSDQIYIDLKQNVQKANVEVLNSLGQVVFLQDPKMEGDRISIDASSIFPGIYRVKVTLGDKTGIKTFVRL